LSHGSSTYKRIPTKTLTESVLRGELAHYPQSKDVSDLQIRRKYFLKNDVDRTLLLSPKITSVIAKDIEKLVYFFNLAQP
jgi:hypothetical protein